MSSATIHRGDCRKVLPRIPSGSVDVVLTDPPYPHIKRSYGTWTEAEWWELMRAVVPECMRILKPTGSAVFILQPNSERVGRMRTWLWEFMTWVGKEWGIVQDAYWWNWGALPTGGACRGGLLRGSVRACVWVGSENCHRDQEAVLLPETEANKYYRRLERFNPWQNPSRLRNGKSLDDERRLRTACAARGGTTPFNVLPIGSDARWNGGTHGHSASTPLPLANWWLRYLLPPGGVVLDPFLGSGTVALAALQQDKDAIGIEKQAEYVAIARRRIREARKCLLTRVEGLLRA